MNTRHFQTIIKGLAILVVLAAASTSFASPSTMTYQGTIAVPSGGAVADGAYPMGFSIWDSSSGGVKLWEEAGHTVSVLKGAFAVELGLTTPLGTIFDSGTPRWLEVAANLGSGTQTFAPRVSLTAVPWATNAANAAHATTADNATNSTNATNASQLNGLTSSAFVPTHTGAIYRWAVFSSYDQASGWMAGNNAAVFGGVTPSTWTDSSGTAAQMSADKEVLRSLYTQKGYGGKNATVVSDTWQSYSSTNGKIATVLFRIKNTTGNPINWTLNFYYTCYGAWGEWASVALNGVDKWNSAGASSVSGTNATVSLSIPTGQTSTIIVVSSSSAPITTRSLLLAFYNNCLQLPAGLAYVDDLDTATGGWTQ